MPQNDLWQAHKTRPHYLRHFFPHLRALSRSHDWKSSNPSFAIFLILYFIIPTSEKTFYFWILTKSISQPPFSSLPSSLPSSLQSYLSGINNDILQVFWWNYGAHIHTFQCSCTLYMTISIIIIYFHIKTHIANGTLHTFIISSQ